VFFAVLVNTLAQNPTDQMIAVWTMARSHSMANSLQSSRNGLDSGKSALKNTLAWIALNKGYGKIPSGWSGADYGIKNLMSKADYDALLAEGPYAFARMIDADQRSGANRYGIKRIRENSRPKPNDCPRGALLVMARGGPSRIFADGDIFVCHGEGTTSHYNGFIKAIVDVDNTYVLGMYAPVNFIDSPPRPPPQPLPPVVVQPPPRPPVVVQPTPRPRVVVQPWDVPVQPVVNPINKPGWVSISAQAFGTENNQLPSETQNSIPMWATALIVLSCVVLFALVVVVVQLARVIRHNEVESV